jgi:RNA polymerase sigma-70 factor (ECF subfamily)
MSVLKQNPIWKEWFARHGPRLLLFARQQSRNDYDAEDLLQEAFVRIWRLYGHTGEVAPGLVFQAIRRLAIDYARRDIRRQRREEKADEVDRIECGSVHWFESSLEKQERHDQLEEAIQQLSANHQEVLMLKVWGELTFEEIGNTLGIPLHTAASRYRHGLANLKAIISKQPQ